MTSYSPRQSKIISAITPATKTSASNSIIGRVPFLARTHLGNRNWQLPIFYSASGKSRDQARRNISDRFKSIFHTRPVLTVPGAGGSSVPPYLAHRPLHFIIAAAISATITTSAAIPMAAFASANRVFISNPV